MSSPSSAEIDSAPLKPVPRVRLSTNIVANATGRAWTVLSQFLLTPIYVALLGIEAFGLVGLYLSATALLQLADLGLGAALNRELARLSSKENAREEMQNLTRTVESLYGLMALLVLGVGWFGSSFVAQKWLTAAELSPGVLTQSVHIMVIALSAQFLCAIYQGALLGLQAHVALNSLNVGIGIFRAVLTCVSLWKISATPVCFFLCQAVTNLLQLGLLRWSVWQRVRADARPQFCFGSIKNTLHYAGAMFALSITTVVLMQLDKIVLSRLLPLATLGYYTLAWSLSQVPANVFSAPIHQTFFPRMAQLLSRGAGAELRETYYLASQVGAIVVIPVSLCLLMFPVQVVDLWLRDPVRANAIAPMLRLLAVGGGLTGLLLIPHSLLLASGQVRFPLRINLAAIVLLCPLMIFLTLRFGALGACFTWALLNTAYLLIYVPTVHRVVLNGGSRRWFVESFLKPLLAGTIAIVAFAPLIQRVEERIWVAFVLGSAWLVSTAVATMGSNQLRALLVGRLRTTLESKERFA